MTLAVTCFTRNYVVQVSDRRLVWLTGPDAGGMADDDQNKALVVCNRIVIAYTGLAQIAGIKTDDWLLEIASAVTPYSLQRICAAIARAATEEFRNLRLSTQLKRHSFFISGWGRVNSRESPLSPFVSVISNAVDKDWQGLGAAVDEFQIRTLALGNTPLGFLSVGQPIPFDVQDKLNGRLRNYVQRERGPKPYIEILAAAVRDTAASNMLVGRNLLAVSLPRTALDKNGGLSIPLSERLQINNVLALYLPEARKKPVWYGPNYTCAGFSYKGVTVRMEP